MAKRYRIPFLNEIGQNIEIVLTPKVGYDATVDLTAVDNTCRISVQGNDDDKLYFGILSKQLDFAYMYDVNNPVDIETFINTEFDAWKVQVFIDGSTRPYFSGFLSIEDNNQRLLDRNDAIFLRATDGLAQLKAVDFVQIPDVVNEEEKKSILNFLVQGLAPIGLTEINLRTLFNVTAVGMPGRNTDPDYDPLDNIFIEPTIFEGLNCYDAVEMICKNTKSRLYQEDGYIWFECLLDRLLARGFSYSEYEIPGTQTDGLYDYTQVSSSQFVNYDCPIGAGRTVRPINRNAIKFLKLARKSTKLTFQYQYPTEWFCNQSFNKFETLIEEVGDIKRWEVECWTHGGQGSLISPDPPVEQAYIQQEFDNVTEAESLRFLALPSEASFANSAKMYSPLFEIGRNDRVEISLERRLKNGYPANSTEIVFYLVLFADDGTRWFMGHPPRSPLDTSRFEWVQTNASLSINARFVGIVYPSSTESKERTDWNTVSALSPACPRNGKLQIILIEGSQDEWPNESHFRDVRINMRTHLSESETSITGDSNIVSDPINTLEKTEETVDFSDLPNYKRYIKGGLFYPPSLYPDLREPWPRVWSFYGEFVSQRAYTRLMAEIMQSHQRKVNYKVESSLKGLIFTADNTTYPIGLLPRYRWMELNPNFEFMLTGSLEIDLHKGHWRGVFVQTMENREVNEYNDSTNYEFKYLTS